MAVKIVRIFRGIVAVQRVFAQFFLAGHYQWKKRQKIVFAVFAVVN